MQRGATRQGSVAADVETALGGERAAARLPWALWRTAMRARLAAAWAEEEAFRRPALWLPVAAGLGAILSLSADREPSLLLSGIGFVVFSALAMRLRDHRAGFALALTLAAVMAGFLAMGWRTARVAAPIVPRTLVTSLSGYVEQIDHRREGARLVLRVVSMERTDAGATPYRVRLTTRRPVDLAPGALVGLKARLLPPARAALPGGYDFARDAYFARIGGVGNVLGRIETRQAAVGAAWSLRFSSAVDRFRNALVARVVEKLPGDTGAIAAAMVAGKRDFLTPSARELIREAGIFHIITISGVQMTLVAGIFFVGFRRLLALSRTLALNYPIKKWAAGLAILGAVAYDIATGSRVGTERALVMTSIFLFAVIVERPSISMRNLGLAAVFVLIVEPEALLGASFQLSFAAVAALVAVWEARLAAMNRARAAPMTEAPASRFAEIRHWLSQARWHGLGAALFATFCATAATSSFMAANFHEFSPYVLIGNPLTLAMIEFFAVPAALVGTLLYPLGLDGPVWLYLGLGIDLVMAIARIIAAAPAATVHLPEFAPWALPFLALAVLSAVLWRTNLLRLTAIPFALIGLMGALNGPKWDVAIQANGETAAVRDGDGRLEILGRKSDFVAEQWLRADRDGRAPAEARGGLCDKSGCSATLPDGRRFALVSDPNALAEDCARADILVTSAFAPSSCAAPLIIDRRALMRDGATTLKLNGEKIERRVARAPGENRPWSAAPRLRVERPDLIRPFDRDAENSDVSGSRWESLE